VDELSKLSSKERHFQVSVRGKSRKARAGAFQRSELYAWLTLTVGVFYGVPALQLVLNHNFRQLDSGDQVSCQSGGGAEKESRKLSAFVLRTTLEIAAPVLNSTL